MLVAVWIRWASVLHSWRLYKNCHSTYSGTFASAYGGASSSRYQSHEEKIWEKASAAVQNKIMSPPFALTFLLSVSLSFTLLPPFQQHITHFRPPQSASFSVSYLSLSPSCHLVHLCSCYRVASHMCLVLLLFLKWSLQAWGHVEWSEKYPFPTPALCSFPEFFMTSRRFRFSDTALALIVFDESVVHINNHVYRHFLIVHFGSMCDVPPGPP